MISNRSLLEHVLVAYREGDMDECIRLVRTLVEAAPLATAPRQLLASLFAQTGRERLALGHYRKLLTASVARGEVIRSVAFQKQIDAFQPPESHVPDRWATLQAQLRSHSLSFLIPAPRAHGRPWTEAQLLALPRPWFERIASETRFEFFGIEPRTSDAESGTVWEVLAGRMRWSFALPDGRASVEALATEGDAVHLDPELARRARLTFVPELPVETLYFDVALARELGAALAGARAASDSSSPTPETRALLPTRPRQKQDLDDLPLVPMPAVAAAPPSLAPPPAAAAGVLGPTRDSGDWLDFGMVSLGEGSAGAGAEPGGPPQAGVSLTPPGANTVAPQALSTGEEATPPTGSGASEPAMAAHGAEASAGVTPEAPEPTGTMEPEQAGVDPPGEPAGPAASEPTSIERDEELIPPEGEEVQAPVNIDAGQPVERRRHPRVAVSYESRMALLRLTEARVSPVRGRLTDLSTSGLRVRFATEELGASRGVLADAVVAVDLELPGPAGSMRVAAQVRWLEVDEQADEARIGIEFVLLTEPDRRRIAGTLARAALAAGFAGRTAA